MHLGGMAANAWRSAAAGALLLIAGIAGADAQSVASNTIETVTVTANRLKATEIKRDAPNVIEIQPVTEIQKLPDVNLAEALQRVPGISMESDSGEGRFVNIRGMDADLNGTAFDGVRFGPDDRMSAIVSYDYHEDWRGIDDMEEDYINEPPDKAYDDLQLRWYKYHRIRQGIGGGFTIDMSDNTALFVRAFHSGYTEYGMKHRLELNNLGDDGTGNEPIPSANGTFKVPDAQAQQIYTWSKEDVGNDLVEGGGHTEFAGGVLLDARLSWTRGTDRFPFNYGFTFTDPNNIPLVYNNRDAGHPFFAATDGTDLANGNNYPFDTGDNAPSNNSDDEAAGSTNLTVPLPIEGYDGELKFGASVRARIRRAIASDAVLLSNNSVLPDFGGTDQTYYNQTYAIGPMANLEELAALPIGRQIVDPSTYEHDRENVYAGYVQYGASFGALDALAGPRVENTNATYTANALNGDDQRIGLSVNPQSYTDFFPDVNLKYHVTDEFQVRAAFSTSIPRPGFNQISAAPSIDVPNLLVSDG
jgi:hypothetical protein